MPTISIFRQVDAHMITFASSLLRRAVRDQPEAALPDRSIFMRSNIGSDPQMILCCRRWDTWYWMEKLHYQGLLSGTLQLTCAACWLSWCPTHACLWTEQMATCYMAPYDCSRQSYFRQVPEPMVLLASLH